MRCNFALNIHFLSQYVILYPFGAEYYICKVQGDAHNTNFMYMELL